MSNSNSNKEDVLLSAIKAVFDSWTGLQLSIAHNFGGSSTKEKANWFLEATHQWILENSDLEDYELEEFFEDTMNTEFNCVLDDDSSLQIARLILEYNKLYLSKEFDKIFQDLDKRFPKNKASDAMIAASKKVQLDNNNNNNAEDDSSSDEGEDDDENEEEDVPMDDETVQSKYKLTNEENENYENLEEGWTFVTKTGKHLTKN